MNVDDLEDIIERERKKHKVVRCRSRFGDRMVDMLSVNILDELKK